MKNEMQEYNIYFRVHENYDGGDVFAKSIELDYNEQSMFNHIGNDGVKGGDPYISMTERIETVVIKYLYGRRKSLSNNEYKYNEVRPSVLLIKLPSENECKNTASVPPQANGYYTTQSLLNNDTVIDKQKNYIAADREVIAYRKIDKEYVYEIHPMLVDLLFALKIIGNNRIYNEILNRIISGDLSIEAVNDKFLKDGLCIDTYGGKAFNDVEKTFIENYYGNRLNIVDTYEKCFPTVDKEIPIEMKMRIGTAVRVGLIKELLREFIPMELSEEITKSFLDDIKNFMMAIEEDTRLSTLGTDLGERRIHMYGNVVLNLKQKTSSSYLYGLEYKCNEDRQVTRYSCISENQEIETIKGGNELRKSFKGSDGEIIRIRDNDEDFEINENGMPLCLLKSIKSNDKITKNEIKAILQDVINHYKSKGKTFPIDKMISKIAEILIDPKNLIIVNGEIKENPRVEDYSLYTISELFFEETHKFGRLSVHEKKLCNMFLGAVFEFFEENYSDNMEEVTKRAIERKRLIFDEKLDELKVQFKETPEKNRKKRDEIKGSLDREVINFKRFKMTAERGLKKIRNIKDMNDVGDTPDGRE